MSLISVETARDLLLEGVGRLELEDVPIGAARDRILGQTLVSRRTQPPFDASAMDGYAVRAADVSLAPTELRVIGESAAGKGFAGSVGPGEAVRIFTGAPVPQGADTVVIQENVDAIGPVGISVRQPGTIGRNIRAAGLDFRTGDKLLAAGTRLDWRTLSIAASMDYATLPVVRRPRVHVLATGDELVPPGASRGPDQIVASNSFGILAFAQALGADVEDLGIAGDNRGELTARIRTAINRNPDILVTLGGASVGDHDSVREALRAVGVEQTFWKVAMRPGKPLMFGRHGPVRVLGLPGNPVSSLVGALLSLRPLIAELLGETGTRQPQDVPAELGKPLPPNDSRADYIRADLQLEPGRSPVAVPFDIQDSSMLRAFVEARCLIVRPPHAPAAAAGDPCRVILL
eukprot:gene25703-27950_t